MRLPPQTWKYDGQTFSVSLYVEHGTVVGMTPVTNQAGTEIPPVKYLGDHLANGIAKAGIKKCSGCSKRQAWINAADQRIRKLLHLG